MGQFGPEGNGMSNIERIAQGIAEHALEMDENESMTITVDSWFDGWHVHVKQNKADGKWKGGSYEVRFDIPFNDEEGE